MDDQVKNDGDTLADSPAKKTRKPAVKRSRAATGASLDTPATPPASETTDSVASGEVLVDQLVKRSRAARRGRAPGADTDEPGLFGAETNPAPSGGGNLEIASGIDPATGGDKAGLTNEDAPSAAWSDAPSPGNDSDGERPVFTPERRAGGSNASSAENAQDFEAMDGATPSADLRPNNPGYEQEASANAANAGARGPEQGAVPPAGQGVIDDRKPWWERKKEKKKQKWLEKQHNRAAHGGHAGHPAIAHGGGHNSGPERPPQQPAPPAMIAPVGTPPGSAQIADPAALAALADELAKDASPLELTEIHAMGAVELLPRVRALGETPHGIPSRRALVEMIFAWAAREKRAFHERGWLDVTESGVGFIVHSANSYRLHPESTCVPAALMRLHGLRRGQEIEVIAQPPQGGERCPVAVRILSVMNTTSEIARGVTLFEELIPYYPLNRILLEAPDIHKDISMRAIDLLTPVGFGQRGLIVAPPRTGKTVLLQNIANSISQNFPEVTLILLLIDERPEEVTDFRRHTKGEVVSSTFDEAPESHVHAAEMVIEKARRLVELGKHVVILLDSITRLARAYNAIAGNGGKTMSGGIESNALQRPKRFFGSARNIEGGGSLTILGTALVDTGSRMDEVIFEEFKGTGNMELHLDRGLSDKRIFPAINIDRSGTRKEELIYHPDEMLRVYGLRRAMQGIPPVEAMDMFIQRLKKTRTNTEFLLSLNR
jgi:transcription termination factor Rho